MSQRERNQGRWSGHPWLSRAMRVLATLGPLVIAVAIAYAIGAALPAPTSFAAAVWRWVLLSAISTVLLLALDRFARRLMPFAALLQLNLVFPDSTPSRYKIARASASTRQLAAEVDEAREHGLSDDRTLAAESVLRLVAALSLHDKATRGHAERTRIFTDMIADELELEESDVDRLRWASLVHDIGKIAVHPNILNKPGKPTDEEWEILRSHPMEGARLTAPLREWLGEWALTIEQHHEQWDGSGYPHGLSGREIGLGARIVAVADAYDVMTARRAYKAPLTPAAAREELARCAGDQFDPMVVRAFLAIPLNRLRAVVGPLSWVAHLPALRPLTRVPSVAGAVTAVAATAAGIVAYGGIADLPSVEEPTIASELVAEAPPVEPPNQGPLAGNVIASTVQDTPVAIDLLGQAVDPDGDPVEVAGVETDRGTVVIGPDGTVVYTPEPGYTGPAGITYTITDGETPAQGSASVTVEPGPNRPPVLQPDVAELDEDGTVTIDVLANDTDPDGDELTIVGLDRGNLLHGTIVDNQDGTVTYTPRRNANGTDELAYRVTDGEDDSQRSMIRFEIAAMPDDPWASNDTYTAEDGGRLVVTAEDGLLANDNDPDGDDVSIDITRTEAPPSSHGTLTVRPDGSFQFDPRTGFVGSTGFRYVVTDGQRAAGARVTIEVEPGVTQPSVTATTPTPAPSEDRTPAWTRDGLFLTGTAVDETTSRMSASRPPSGRIPDWDGDDDPGLTVYYSKQEASEDDPKKFHDWLHPVTERVRLDGPVSLTLTSAVKDMKGDEEVEYSIFLYSCDNNGRSCSRIASTRENQVEDWNREGRWSTRTLPVGTVRTTLPAGSTLRLKLLFGEEKIWIPLTGDRPSVLNVTAGG